jgi:hypothetical protein
MPTAKSRITRKHFRLDIIKLKKVQKALGAKTETETVKRALDLVIAEFERTRLVAKANREFRRTGIVTRDVFLDSPNNI